MLVSYERKLTQLQKNKTLIRFVTQARLRAQIDRINNKTLDAVQTLESLIKGRKIDQIYSGDQDEFRDLLEEIEKEESEIAKRRILSQSFEREKSIEDENTKEALDNKLSLIQDPQLRSELLSKLLRLAVRPLSTEGDLSYVMTKGSGFEEEEVKEVGDFLYGRSVSTYPIDSQTKRRDGDPICDQFCAQIFENRIIAAVADGCNWGEPPKEAARKASRMFVSYIKRRQHTIRDTIDAANLVMRAFGASHKAIIEGTNEETILNCGTTTMVAGLILELEQEYDKNQFVFVFGSIGDCKAYHYSLAQRKLIEITKGNRGNSHFDPRNPGGRIGPHLEGGEPDISNFMLWTIPCQTSDLLVLVSDGVHDNFGFFSFFFIPKNLHIFYFFKKKILDN